MAEEMKRLAILEEMDQFNSAPIEQSGSIMEGILHEQQGTNFESSEEPIEEPKEDTKKELPNEYMVLNTSIQELNKRLDERFTNYDRRLSEITSNYQTYQPPQQTQQAQQPTYQYDPDAPVTMAHLNQVVQAYTSTNQAAQEAMKNSILTRAQNEYWRYKQENPNFNLDPREIDNTVQQAFKTGQIDLVKNANWRGFFNEMHRPTLDNELISTRKELEAARKEIEAFKKKPAASIPTTPVSPAVGRNTSRPSAIESPVNNDSTDITKWKSFNKKGDFKGFGNEFKRNFKLAK